MKVLVSFLSLYLAVATALPAHANEDPIEDVCAEEGLLTSSDMELDESFLADPLNSQSQLLVSVISEPENGIVHELTIATAADGSIERLYRISPTSKQEITPEDIIAGEVVLARAEGRDALLISCPNCSVQAGGRITLKYLVNGLWMTYREFHMNLGQSGGIWQLSTLAGAPITTLRLVANRIFGRLVGISEVHVES